jgi:hypothetical protein
MMSDRYVTSDEYDPRSRFGLYRLCDCPTCHGRGQVRDTTAPDAIPVIASMSSEEWAQQLDVSGGPRKRCSDCRGEGRIRQEVASCESPEAVGVALVTLGREHEWEGCAFGLLDREGEKGEKWLVLPWLPSPRNVSDAGRLLRSSRK